MKISDLYALQHEFFLSGKTRPLEFRRKALTMLEQAITRHRGDIFDALSADLGKAPMEGYLTEVAVVQQELRYARRHLKSWAKPRRVATPWVHWPAKSFVLYEPKGVVLTLAPWNYPFQLCLAPVVGAIAAGNCVMVKPSKISANVSRVINVILGEVFQPEYVACVDLSANSYEEILDQPYHHILFTGSEYVGKLVMSAAAKHLSPVTLELGGKSPCIIDPSADLKLTSRRIVWGKFLNCGQTCVAPDYILVHRSIRDRLVEELKSRILEMYGENPLENPDYPKIINQRHFERLVNLIPGPEEKGKILFGAQADEAARKISPTLLGDISFDCRVMQEEIFGPILPIIAYDSLDETIRILQRRPKPLALYLFTQSRSIEHKVLSTLSFGGGCVNDAVVHFSNHHLPFGGVGASGMGAYHGKTSFETFSHAKSILKKSLWLDLPLRYPPYTDRIFKLVKMILR